MLNVFAKLNQRNGIDKNKETRLTREELWWKRSHSQSFSCARLRRDHNYRSRLLLHSDTQSVSFSILSFTRSCSVSLLLHLSFSISFLSTFFFFAAFSSVSFYSSFFTFLSGKEEEQPIS